MKPQFAFLPILLASNVLMSDLTRAATYYWDNNDTAAGFGAAGGTWTDPTLSQWSTDGTGVASPGASITTAGSAGGTDAVNFGNGATGLSAGTINVSGTVNSGNITFASGTGNIILSGGVINLSASNVISNSSTTASHTINSNLTGAGTAVIFEGAATGTPNGGFVLGGSNSFTGELRVGATNSAKVTFSSAGNLGSGSLIQLGANNSTIGVLEYAGGSSAISLTKNIGIGNQNGLVSTGGATIQNNNVSSANTLTFSNSTFNAASANAITASRTLTLGGSNSGDNTISGAILNNGSGAAGVVSLVKADAGTWILSGANLYTGTTTISGGTLKLSGGNNRLLSTGTLAFTGAGTLDVGSTEQTLAAVTVADTANFTGTISGSGGKLTINGASNLEWGPGGIMGTNVYNTVINLGGLSTFVYNSSANTFRVGFKSGATQTNTTTGSSTVTLAGTNNITAATLAVGDVGASNHGGTHTLHLGTTNTLNIGSINVGYSGRSNAALDFAAPGSSVTIRAVDGSSAVASWNIGLINNVSNDTVFTDTVNFTNGSVDALVTSMTIGNALASGSSRRGTTNASFLMGNGTLTAGTINLGQYASSGSPTINGTSVFAGNGTFTLNHASGVANITTLTLATNTGLATGGSARSTSGIFNLTNGTLNATTVQRGAQTGNATAVTTAFNWANGTIGNIAGGDLTWNNVPITLSAGTHTFDISGSNTATLNSASPIGGGAFGITKQGTGTLTFNAANTYSGNTTVTGGTLALSGSGSVANSPVITINSSATLSVTAISGSTFTLGSAQTLAGNGTVLATGKTVVATGTLAPGNSPGILIQDGGTLQLGVGGDYNWQIHNVSGVAGTGYDTTSLINGAVLDLSLLGVGSEYNINLWSLSGIGPDVNGDAINFNNALNYAWTLFSTDSVISGFDVTDFNINIGAFNGTDGFDNALAGGVFNVALADGNTDLVLTFTSAIPEPGSTLLGSVGCMLLLFRRRRPA